ncbi:hypothetical protein NL676_027095 [Syzygium grande]|nr:hypothetical protein NL676_027095 [Syzygium grande]
MSLGRLLAPSTQGVLAESTGSFQSRKPRNTLRGKANPHAMQASGATAIVRAGEGQRPPQRPDNGRWPSPTLSVVNSSH